MAKFMPQFNRPYEVTQAFPESFLYKLKLPPTTKTHPTFHVTQICTHTPNDDQLFPSCTNNAPKLLVTPDGSEEYFIDEILEHRPRGWGHQFLVHWSRYGPQHDLWLPRSELLETEVLALYEAQNV